MVYESITSHLSPEERAMARTGYSLIRKMQLAAAGVLLLAAGSQYIDRIPAVQTMRNERALVRSIEAAQPESVHYSGTVIPYELFRQQLTGACVDRKQISVAVLDAMADFVDDHNAPEQNPLRNPRFRGTVQLPDIESRCR